MKNEPIVIAASVVGSILTIVTALIAFGIIDWTPEQTTAFEAVLVSCVPLVLTALGAWYSRNRAFGPVTVATEYTKNEPEAAE